MRATCLEGKLGFTFTSSHVRGIFVIAIPTFLNVLTKSSVNIFISVIPAFARDCHVMLTCCRDLNPLLTISARPCKKYFTQSGAHHLEPATSPYSYHGVFTDRSIFSLNLSRIQIPTGTSVTNCNHKHGLMSTRRNNVDMFT